MALFPCSIHSIPSTLDSNPPRCFCGRCFRLLALNSSVSLHLSLFLLIPLLHFLSEYPPQYIRLHSRDAPWQSLHSLACSLTGFCPPRISEVNVESQTGIRHLVEEYCYIHQKSLFTACFLLSLHLSLSLSLSHSLSLSMHLSLNLSNNVRQCANIIVSIILFHHSVTYLQSVGLSIVFACLLLAGNLQSKPGSKKLSPLSQPQ